MLATTRRGGGWLFVAIAALILILFAAVYRTHHQNTAPELPMHVDR